MSAPFPIGRRLSAGWRDDDEGSLRQFAFEKVRHAILDESGNGLERLAGRCYRFFREKGAGDGFGRPAGGRRRYFRQEVAHGSVRALVHGEIGQAIGVHVFAAEDVLNAERLQLRNATLRFVIERAQVGTFDAIFALHLLDHKLRVCNDAKVSVACGKGEFEGRQEAGILGKIICFNVEELV